MKVLYVGPRTIQPLEPECDVLVPDHHLTVGSLQCASKVLGFEVETVYYDDFYRERDETAEEFVTSWCAVEKPDAVVFGGTRTKLFETEAVIAKLATLSIPTIHLWWDHISPENRDLAEFYTQRRLTLNVIMDLTTSAVDLGHSQPERFINMWYPLDEELFCPDWAIWLPHTPIEDEENRDIDVCFMGTAFPGNFQNRVDFLEHLKKEGIKFFSKAGAYGKEPLAIEEYAQFLRRSKIGLNFTYMPKFDCSHCKTRTFETMAAGALLLEQDCSHTRHWFTPEIDYVPFSTPEELVSQIRYYLANYNERLAIALQGENRVRQAYTPVAFWEKVFRKLDSLA